MSSNPYTNYNYNNHKYSSNCNQGTILYPKKSDCECNKCHQNKSCIMPYTANINGYNFVKNPFNQALWKVRYLVSNKLNAAAQEDPEMIDPWDVSVFDNKLYVANGSTDKITVYDMFGFKLSSITIRAQARNTSFPTALQINDSGGFITTTGSTSRSSNIIVATEHGTIHAYNAKISGNIAPEVTDVPYTPEGGGRTIVFKGLTIGENKLYLAEFISNRIITLNNTYNPATDLISNPFVDQDSINPLPSDARPHNVAYICPYIYVIYTIRDPNIPQADLPGPGNGYVSEFKPDGTFVRRLITGGKLNSPWAMIAAPCVPGYPKGGFLVGNQGDGYINIYDNNGVYYGQMLNLSGTPIKLDGLWGLFQNPRNPYEIYFTNAFIENVEGYLGVLTTGVEY